MRRCCSEPRRALRTQSTKITEERLPGCATRLPRRSRREESQAVRSANKLVICGSAIAGRMAASRSRGCCASNLKLLRVLVCPRSLQVTRFRGLGVSEAIVVRVCTQDQPRPKVFVRIVASEAFVVMPALVSFVARSRSDPSWLSRASHGRIGVIFSSCGPDST